MDSILDQARRSHGRAGQAGGRGSRGSLSQVPNAGAGGGQVLRELRLAEAASLAPGRGELRGASAQGLSSRA